VYWGGSEQASNLKAWNVSKEIIGKSWSPREKTLLIKTFFDWLSECHIAPCTHTYCTNSSLEVKLGSINVDLLVDTTWVENCLANASLSLYLIFKELENE